MLLVCFVTSLFVFDYFYQADFVDFAKIMLTFAVPKQRALVNRFTTNLENILAYGQSKDNHCWHTVGT